MCVLSLEVFGIRYCVDLISSLYKATEMTTTAAKNVNKTLFINASDIRCPILLLPNKGVCLALLLAMQLVMDIDFCVTYGLTFSDIIYQQKQEVADGFFPNMYVHYQIFHSA